ncbi:MULTISPECIES: hypothetical protein [Bizionia]|uniref:Cell wall anchor protein n=2 Tax=Bizionia TaxID=283785 RepID=A0A5D0R1M7_9FLAO|nr:MULTISPECIES: hypothetical protein [Bizionia]OBX23091.1 hypothetical protein BAA08_06020 [Bizionia sp. APA-3]TYB74751.1 hypothetical protein ES675_01035 [Bizionia algoritergicola]
MKTKKLLLNAFGLMALFLLTTTGFSQVGIGTLMPDDSAMLDVQSTSKGLLAPRMTTLERDAIATPAESLLVFDTDEKAFYFYNTATTTWVKLANDASVKRNNYKLIKTVADLSAELAAGGGSSYKLASNTFYEINGTILLAASIDLQNAYVAGIDASEDVLSYAGGTVFKGSTGGSIRNVTIKGSKAFEITGPGIATASSLLVQNSIIDGMTNVGSIDGLGLFFGNIVQFLNNANGITYSNIGNLLLNNQAWFGSNSGTFEKFTGTFGLIEKVSGFSTVSGSAVALDVSTTGLAVGTGVLQATVFTGTTSAPSGYVKGYAPAQTYLGYNFSNAWTVSAPGIPRENDDVATGNLYYDEANPSNVVNVTNTTPFKLPVNTKSIRLFRTAEGAGGNRITYKGETRRPLNIFGTASLTATSGTRLAFSIYKNGSRVTGTEAIVDVIQTNSRQSVTVIGTVDVVKDDYIEIFVQKISSGSEQLLITSYNLIVN